MRKIQPNSTNIQPHTQIKPMSFHLKTVRVKIAYQYGFKSDLAAQCCKRRETITD